MLNEAIRHEIRLRLDGEQATLRMGEIFGRGCAPGTIIALHGDLGAGKTTFVRGLVAGLGAAEGTRVTSPTFTLVGEYQGRLRVFHFDVYRLGSELEFLELGAEEMLSSGGVCVVEWAEKVEGCLPDDRVDIHLGHAGPHRRNALIVIMSTGADRLAGLLQKGDPKYGITALDEEDNV
ncbi:MAG TPA: tRNA (adenosine(37)-N6)-threonylcarbamoyltransferase complex ATPase subunit type 1 TsaE [Candidatus Brocadiia bacterium]|nr:tRNA (adenosine(37)-N6)-threonylcarbamoyltransferase complex ATPase subunit type 1 TsaE [Candidatus Brocadiia bacterium]